MIEPPYAADTRAKGWRFELDHERIRQSDTWALASPEIRPWLLMLWMVAWEQTPCGSLPAEPELIAARIGMSPRTFDKHATVLLRGWQCASDGRLYHAVLTERVRELLEYRDAAAKRKADYRARMAAERAGTQESRESPASVPRDSTVQNATGTGTGTGTKEEKEKTARKRASTPPETVGVSVLVEAGFEAAVASEFIAHKARKKAPLTPRAWADHLAESKRAGWTPQQAAEKVLAKGWRGFEARYVDGERPAGQQRLPAPPSFRERDARAAAEEVNRWTGGRIGTRDPFAPIASSGGEVVEMPEVNRDRIAG